MKIFWLIMFFWLANIAQAREFRIVDLPQGWQAKLEVEQCSENECSGKGRVHISNHTTQQTFERENWSFYVRNLTAEQDTLPHNDSPIELADFNFDGTIDSAILIGHFGPYGSATYDIYVQTPSGKFIRSAELSDLTENFMGLPQIDSKHKTLTTWGKSGCCYHVTNTWRVIPNKGLQEIAQTIWDATQSENHVEITEKQLINGKWRTQTRREKRPSN